MVVLRNPTKGNGAEEEEANNEIHRKKGKVLDRRLQWFVAFVGYQDAYWHADHTFCHERRLSSYLRSIPPSIYLLFDEETETMYVVAAASLRERTFYFLTLPRPDM